MENFTNLGKTVISDIRTYRILSANENYRERLFEAYNYLKKEGVLSLEDFQNREGLKVGAFTYEEITIFDRIADIEYQKELSNAPYNIGVGVEEAIANPNYGDELASYGTLGKTSNRGS